MFLAVSKYYLFLKVIIESWIYGIAIFKSHVSLLDLCDFVNFLSRLRLQDNFYPAIKLRPTLPKKGERSS